MPPSLTLPLLMIILSVVAFSFLSLAYKQAAVLNCRPMAFSTIFNLVATILSLWRVFSEESAWADWRLWALGISMGAVLYFAISLTVVIGRLGPMSIIWTVTNLSLLIPIILSTLFLGETLLYVDGALLALFIVMIIAMRSGAHSASDTKHNIRGAFWLVLAILFLCNGLFQFGSKLKETLFPGSSAAALAALFYGSGVVMAFITHVIKSRSYKISATEWRTGALAGASSSIGCILLLNAMHLPVVVVFAASLGVSLIGGVALTAIIYREHLTTGKLIGWLLGLGVVILSVAREQIDALLK